jgi:ferredoxin
LGVCDECKVATGEIALSDAIADAEEWSGESVGLEIDEADLTHGQNRAYKRSQFVSNLTTAGTRLVTRGNPALAGAQAVANRLSAHSKQITELQKKLEQAAGTQNAQSRHRMLTRKRRLVLAALQKYPDLADEMHLEFPHIDASLCTMCDACSKACTIHALEMDKSGRVTVEQPYCVNCGACAAVCPEGAIHMQRADVSELVLPDEEAEKRERQRRRTAKLKEQGKETLNKGLDLLEGLAEDK